MTIPRPNPAGRFDPACLFQPESVAVIGAGTVLGDQLLARIRSGGFTGTIVSSDADGMPAVAPDLAVIATPPWRIPRVLEGLAALGCFAGIVPGPADGLAEHTARTGVRVLGAQSFGLAVPRLGLNATLAHMQPPPGRLALVSQSAGLSRAVLDWAGPNGVGFSHVVGVGDNDDIGFATVLDWLARDPGTGAILLDIHRLKNRRLFLSAARAAARLRPVVAMRAGAALCGASDAAFEAALRRAGVLTVGRFENLLAAAETLSRARPLRHEALAILSNTGGVARMAADTARHLGLTVSQVRVVPGAELASQVRHLAADPAAGGILVVHAPGGDQDDETMRALVAATPAIRAPLLISAMGETTGAGHRRVLADAGLPVFAAPEQAVRGFLHMVLHRRNRLAAQELPPSAVLSLAPAHAEVERVFREVRRHGRLSLAQDEALTVLAAYGVATVPTRAVATAEDAAAAASLLGFPAVVKLRQSESPADRATAGLALDLDNEAACARAAARILDRADPAGEPCLLVQRQAARARELAIRVAEDPVFGPTIAFGAGGTAADPTDVAVDLPPLNLPLARALIRRHRIGARLEHPLRDRPAANIEAVAETLVRISQLIVDFPEIAALDLPSLFTDERGVLAADAWLGLRAPGEPPARLAIAPYPAELTEHFDIAGERMTVRPIRPEDADAHGAFFKRLSPTDIRFRFFSAMKELSPEQTVRLTQVDYEREMAFIAVREATGETVGVSRLICETSGGAGEFAVIVQADMKGRGLAKRLMRRLIDWGRSRGLTDIVGQVLADNAPMLAFVRHLGFTVQRMQGESDVVEVRLPIAP